MNVSLKPIYVDIDTVATMVALSSSTIQSMVRQGDFPKPRQLSGRRVGWMVREIEEWADSRPVSDLPPPENTGARKPRRPAAPTDQQAA